MRQKSKRFILMLCVLACFVFLTACGSSADDPSRYTVDPSLAESISFVSEGLLEEISSFNKEDAAYAEEELRNERQDVLADGVAEWATVADDTGPFIRALTSQVVMEDADTYICTVYAEYANRNLEYKIYYKLDYSTQSLAPTGMSFTPEYTLGEKIQKAFLNMLLGMGLVFVILIFLSLLISCFRFISVAQNRFKKESRIPEGTGASLAHADTAVGRRSALPKAVPDASADIRPDEDTAPDEAVIAERPQVPAAQDMDDLELVAVIAAAIAASENIPADGLRVRSIRRVSGSKWKNQ